jgi:hypothetical protein
MELVPLYVLAKNLECSIYTIGLAVIVSALIDVITFPVGLTPYRALIVLNIVGWVFSYTAVAWDQSNQSGRKYTGRRTCLHSLIL